jgi:hypothetical protein
LGVIFLVAVLVALGIVAARVYRRPDSGFSDSLEHSETLAATRNRRLFSRNEWRGTFALSDRQRRRGR